MKLKQIYEELKQVSPIELIVKAGTILFHGTGEEFDDGELRTGGYDKLMWTTDKSSIAQTYIPIAGSSMMLTTNSLMKPPSQSIGNIQKVLGITFDINDNEVDKFGRLKSWKTPPEFLPFYKEAERYREAYHVAYQNLEKAKASYSRENGDDIRKLLPLEAERDRASAKYREEDPEKKIVNYIHQQLKKFGYEPDDKRFEGAYTSWTLKMKIGKLQRGDYRLQGRLFILKPKRDLKIYDMTNGGKMEGDLMDLQYHALDAFEAIGKSGYDGVRINDFAQSVDMGNTGHTSIGIFKDKIKDLNINTITAQHHELEGNFKTGDWNSPEYKKYLEKK